MAGLRVDDPVTVVVVATVVGFVVGVINVVVGVVGVICCADGDTVVGVALRGVVIRQGGA